MASLPPSAVKAAYRPDIDGLRAVAVLLVLFNHVGIVRFSGGFIGVDVFFVISGYLISGILLRDIAAGQFSLARFYGRRFRRILPALLVMLLATSVLVDRYFFPSELKSFAETELGALLSFSNVALLHQGGYFDIGGKLKPLLHTWSLGVEEQFYIAFPLALFALVRWGRRYLKGTLWTLTLAGFCLDWYWTGHSSASQAFYLAPLRAWELLLGVLLAAGAMPALDTPRKRNVASTCGLLLILAAGVHYHDWTPFPGWRALPPALGALLVIAAGETGTSIAGTVLSWKPLRWIGLISYSLYLWHWPIQVFQTTSNILVPDRYPTAVAKLAVIVASIAVGALSWRLIEQPFRGGRLRAPLPLFSLTGATFAVLLSFSVWLLHYDGWLPPSALRSAAYTDFLAVSPTPQQIQWTTCYVDPRDFAGHFSPSKCLVDDPSRKHYLLIGDSHAAHFYWALQQVFPDANLSEMAVTGCTPVRVHPATKLGLCDPSTDFIFNNYLAHQPVDTILLVGRWDDSSMAHLGETVAWIQQHGMKAVVVGPSIEFDASLVRLLQLAHREHDPNLPGRHRDLKEQQRDHTMQQMARDEWHVPYISMYEDLCNTQTVGNAESAGGCPVHGVSNIALLWDTDHLSPAGGLLFARTIRAHHQLP